MRFAGDLQRFALGFELVPDPDAGAWLRARSWGRLQIWIAGHNITLGHTRTEETLDAAEVPLLPVVEWLASVWDPLLHEERLPRRSKTLSAASWRMDVLAHLPPTAGELDDLMRVRESYWRRHGLGSALPDFRIPDLHFRRRSDKVELSWDDREWRTVPTGVLLAERPGHALLPAAEVAGVLFDFASAVLDTLGQLHGAPEEAVGQLAALRARMTEHRTADHHVERLKWWAGLDIEAAAHRLRKMAGVVSGTVLDTVQAILGLDSPREPALVTHATLPALLFRSAAPTLSPNDLNVLIRLAGEAPSAESLALQPYRTPAPLSSSAWAVTSDGLERALEFRDALSLPPEAPLTGDFDLETVLLPRLGIRLEQVHLDDVSVDGIAIAGPDRAPVIAVNGSSPRAATPWGRRATLAHELCHLLFDMDDTGRVGLVSNPWADAAMERRANAFAVMLLAPEAAIRTSLARERAAEWTRADLNAVMKHLVVGITTLTWQLQNLGWIDAASRESWLDNVTHR